MTAFQCFVAIIKPYYQYLENYIQAILNVTVPAIQAYNSGFPFSNYQLEEQLASVGLQAIEFWSAVAEHETMILDAEQEERQAEPYLGFTLGALPHLIQDLCGTLLKQDEDEDNESLAMAQAAGSCIRLMSVTVGDDIVPLIQPFIQQSIGHPEWRHRDGGIVAFGSILEGTQAQMMPLISECMPTLLERMGDESIVVRDSTAWALGRVVKFHPEIVDGSNVAVLIQRMVDCLGQEARVVRHVCWVLNNIAEAFTFVDGPSSPLSPYFKIILDGLMGVIQRPNDDTQFTFRLHAYEAMNALLSAAPQDCYGHIQEVFPLFFTELSGTLSQHPLGQDEIMELHEKQALLVTTLFTITKKLPEEAAMRSDNLMQLYVALIETENPGLQEEVLLCIGVLSHAVGPHFEIYLDKLLPILQHAISNWQAAEACCVAVGVVADLYRILGQKLVSVTDGVVRSLLHVLQQKVDKSVRPPILVAFGDIAVGIEGEYFSRYFKPVMDMLQMASNATVDTRDRELVDYLNELRFSVIQAWTGILHGMHATNNQSEFKPYVQDCVSWLVKVYTEERGTLRNDTVTRALVGVLGDLAHTLKKEAATALRADNVLALLQKEMHSDNAKIAEDAQWAYTEIGTLPY